jgi:hypothetical protein
MFVCVSVSGTRGVLDLSFHYRARAYSDVSRVRALEPLSAPNVSLTRLMFGGHSDGTIGCRRWFTERHD